VQPLSSPASHVLALASAALLFLWAPDASLSLQSGPPPGPMQGPGGPGRGPGGPGGPGGEIKLVDQFDRDGDKRLNDEERAAAREHLAQIRSAGGRMGPPRGGPGGRMGGPEGPRGGRGGRGPGGADLGPAAPGRAIAAKDVKTFATRPTYDASSLRTFFLEFTNPAWEDELEAFSNTDVEVPATLVVDGQRYRDIGVHFRGASSLMNVPDGRKRSLNLSLDFVHEQALGGYRTFNLLNSHMDPTFLRSMLYLQAARAYLPAPQANYARVVINGESWGVYVSAQQFNKDFVRDFYKTTDGARWKVPGRPGGRGGLEYLGDDPELYKRLY